MPALEWLQGGQSRGRLELSEGIFLRLGRGKDADGRVEGDPYMSRLHVEVVLEGDALRVRRLPNASNSVFHDGAEKDAFKLAPGESFVIGATRFRFVFEAAAPGAPVIVLGSAPAAVPTVAPTAEPTEPVPAPKRATETTEVHAASDRMRLERFFSRRVVESLLAGKDLKELEPKLADSTVMFFDIRGFSKLAELGAPEISVFQEKMRRVMTGMTDEILKEDGVVLQYMGDGIVACWNVPQASDDHVDRACRAALAMTKRLAEVDPELRCGIGLHTGRVVAGTIGSDQIFAYGVIGAAISRAARVEGITRIVGVPIIATREVVDLLSESSGVAATPLGMYRPAGTTADLELYEISAGPGNPERLEAFEAAEVSLAVGAWTDVIKALAGRIDKDAAAYYLASFAEKCLKDPPADWRGVIELGGK